jgi:ribosomal protein S18 acetylase RimI-like enzyme
MPANQRQGYGTALLKKICEILPERALLLLGVDKDTPATEQLCAWYIRQGFARFLEQPDEIILARELWSSSQGTEEGERQSESSVY